MGCNCKDTATAAQKYTKEPTFEKVGGVRFILELLFKIITFILIFCIIIVAMPIIALWLIISIVFGIETKINIKKLFNIHGK